MSPPADELHTLRCTGIDLAGDGIGPAEGRTVHVQGLFPGDTARVSVVHRTKHSGRARGLLRVLREPAPERRRPPCPRHREREGACTGCPLMGLTEPAQRRAKRQMLADQVGLAVDALVHLPDAALGYRHSAKRVAFARDGRLALGSYVRGSHRGADMEGCLVDHPRIREAADELARRANELGVTPYDERRAQGDLRYVWLKTDGRRVLLTLITASERSRAAEQLAPLLSEADGVAWSVQGSQGNALRGGPARTVRGVERLSLRLAGVDVECGPLGFLQPNPAVLARAYRDLVEGGDATPPRGRLALDLYAGAGVTTELLRAHFDEVHPWEQYPESAQALGVPPRSVEAALASYRGPAPDLVVANPPRAGLRAATVAGLRRVAPRRIHIMSCGPKGLAADLAGLTASGDGARYQLDGLRAYDSLPQTPHLELVAWLSKRC